MIRVHVASPLEADPLATLRERLDERIALGVGAEPPDPADYQVLVAGRPTAELLDASPSLRALVVPFAGLPRETAGLMRAYPLVSVHNLHHNAASTAEMAVALLLAAARELVPIDREFRRGWDGALRRPGIQLTGKTALVLGCGAIGQRVALALHGLGMRVLGVRRRAGLVPVEPHLALHPAERLHALLPRAQALICCLPDTPSTEGLVGERELALLPEGALLVNVGRGPSVAEDALYEALRSGRLAGAGLDVWYRYPGRDGAARPATRPFWELDNVVLSPHRAGTTDRTEVDRVLALAELLGHLARGEPMPNRIDLTAGY